MFPCIIRNWKIKYLVESTIFIIYYYYYCLRSEQVRGGGNNWKRLHFIWADWHRLPLKRVSLCLFVSSSEIMIVCLCDLLRWRRASRCCEYNIRYFTCTFISSSSSRSYRHISNCLFQRHSIFAHLFFFFSEIKFYNKFNLILFFHKCKTSFLAFVSRETLI